ncbi:nuclear transport factor 2 family protein [Microbacterium sp.]|uniref:nuclear transport factor 2 family protein n=1 Tax=Microbacterium sp. TaxID=51671 RepID=UPI003C77D9F4
MTATRNWLDGYLTAWRTKRPDDIRAIFTDDAEYFYHPYDAEPTRGIDAILTDWEDPEPTEPIVDFEVLVEGDRLGIVRGRTEYPGHATYWNLWEVHLAEDGRAHRFIEWYMKEPDDAA